MSVCIVRSAWVECSPARPWLTRRLGWRKLAETRKSLDVKWVGLKLKTVPFQCGCWLILLQMCSFHSVSGHNVFRYLGYMLPAEFCWIMHVSVVSKISHGTMDMDPSFWQLDVWRFHPWFSANNWLWGHQLVQDSPSCRQRSITASWNWEEVVRWWVSTANDGWEIHPWTKQL